MQHQPQSQTALSGGFPMYAIPFVRCDGFLVRMFGARDAAFFIESLFNMKVDDVYLIRGVPGWSNAFMVNRTSVCDTRHGYDAMTNNLPLWILDFIPSPMYHVVPQKIWSPPNQSDWRRYVEQAHLRMPVFFIQNDRAIGLPLPRATVGDKVGLRGADIAAPLGGGHSTQIRIAVSSLPLPSLLCLSPAQRIVASQWPGYDMWARQIQIRDNTPHRNEITLKRFVKLVAGVVDRFLTVRLICYGLWLFGRAKT